MGGESWGVKQKKVSQEQMEEPNSGEAEMKGGQGERKPSSPTCPLPGALQVRADRKDSSHLPGTRQMHSKSSLSLFWLFLEAYPLLL